ncbi:MAG: hypothetical protein ACR2FY_10150 [Pirellulaceae bacterium]
MPAAVSHVDPMTEVLADFRRQEATDFDHAWVGMEPTFQSAKSVQKWKKMSAKPEGEDAYFEDDYMLKTQKKVAKKIKKRYEEQREEGQAHCMFAGVELDDDLDPWQVRRQNLRFHWKDEALEPLEVRLSLDPETFEYSIKPVPLAWFYDERFVKFLEEFVWKTPRKLGLSFAIAHGGGQFSLSAKTVMTGCLLADDIAAKLNHPELATWIMDWPNPDDRAFRATRQRHAAFQQILKEYWAGRFHPRANGVLTVKNALLDRGFGPACAAPAGLMDPQRGPLGNAREVFQTNFAFGRTVRWSAQNVHPGYWQSAHPEDDGYRPDQIMRYSEGNLNRLQIAGELHVKSGKVLDRTEAPEFDAPLELAQLTTEASWENRAQMSRTSARDYVEAQLLYVHYMRHLQQHPHPTVTSSLLQDQILGDAEETLRRHGVEETLDQLRRAARKINLDSSRGRMNTDWIEPEVLFWASWRALPAGEKGAVAREVIGNFLAYVHEAAAMDQRPAAGHDDPMEWHRHRIHPVLWRALLDAPSGDASHPVNKELTAWQGEQVKYMERRPMWSQIPDASPPWA